MSEGLDKDEVLRLHGSRADCMAIAGGMGLDVRGQKYRLKCPFDGCNDKPEADRTASVSVTEKGGIGRLKCFRCGGFGTAIDLVKARDNCDFKEALAHLAGQAPVIRPKPPPKLFALQGGAEDPDKLKPEVVRAAWKAMADHDDLGVSYLHSRGLELEEPRLLKYTSGEHPDKSVRGYHSKGRRIAMLLTDVLGQPRGIQFRLAREPQSKQEPKNVCLKGSILKTAFFGEPEKISDSFLVCVTEGIADTIAVAQWSAGSKKATVDCIVGAAGKDNLVNLGLELREKSISVEGVVFALFPQNDRPEHKSRIAFRRLSQVLEAMGGTVVWVDTPAEHKDVAVWCQREPTVQEWPPEQLKRALEFREEDEEKRPKAPDGQRIPLPDKIEVKSYAQDFSTLCALLDDASSRESILGPGDLRMHASTQEVYLGSGPLAEVDWAAVRLGIEGAGTTPEGRRLRFGREDIQQAISLVASRKKFSPVKDYLSGLSWDGQQRLDDGLPKALGVDPGTLEALFLRRWCIQAVARGLEPGCKADCVLILVGEQGVGKSRFFDVMGGEFFTDSPMKLDDKDACLMLGKFLIIEWAELDSMRRARDAQSTKAFLTSRADTFRPPYGRNTVTIPRCCVIVGTTNDEGFLSDPTGSRRFWPVKVKGVDVNWVKVNRDQLWAEAVNAFGAGEIHYIESEHSDALAAHAAKFEQHDSWGEDILEFHESEKGKQPDYTTGELLDMAIKKPVSQITLGDQMRVGRVCSTLLGWKRVMGRRSGRRVWVYRVPERAPGQEG